MNFSQSVINPPSVNMKVPTIRIKKNGKKNFKVIPQQADKDEVPPLKLSRVKKKNYKVIPLQVNAIVNHACSECGASFREQRTLNKHISTHRINQHFEQLPVKKQKVSIANEYSKDVSCDQHKSCFNNKIYAKIWKHRGTSDLLGALKKYRELIQRSIFHHLNKHGPLKFYVTLKVHLYKLDNKSGDRMNEEVYLNGMTRSIMREGDFDQIYDASKNKIWERFDTWMKNGSGYKVDRIENIQLNISKYTPIKGSTYIKTPKSILNKKAVVNVRNQDELCFIWSVLSALYNNAVVNNFGNVYTYSKYLHTLKFDGISMPMQIDDIDKFEKLNDLAINVYSIKHNGSQVNPLRISKIRDKVPINLLLIIGKEKNHYVWIKNFNRLLCYDPTNTAVFCPFCMYGFIKRSNGEEKLRKHIPYCIENGAQRVDLPPIGKRTIKFNDIEKGEKLAFCIYADFECINKPIDDKSNKNTKKITIHEVSGYTFTTISPFYKPKTESYRGSDAGFKFLEAILKEEERIKCLFKKANKEMNPLTPKQQKRYDKAKICYICKEDFKGDSVNNTDEKGEYKGCKVRDHCHFTGKYRGAAHQICNIKFRVIENIPVFFHNLAGYDAHIIFQNLHKVKGIEEPKVLAKSMEKFITFQIGTLHFKDSAQFLGASLEKLVSNLKVKAIKENNMKGVFKNTYNYFNTQWKHIPEDAFELLTRKGVYPYTYFDSFDRFTEDNLPPKELYYNDLSMKHITDEDYDFAHKIWDTFKLQNLGGLHDLYMESDVVLLADIFENFRDFSLHKYELDPAHFCTAPSLSWSAALKYTKVKLDLIIDPDMNIFVDRGLIGGISMIGNHFARANNPELGDLYDKNKQNSYIMLLDCNNQYGWAMSQYLPTGGFEWVNDIGNMQNVSSSETSDMDWSEKIMELADEANVGYMFEIDLEYPQTIHDYHDTYPLAPEHLTIKEEMLSLYQKKLAHKLDIKVGGEKLCLTLQDKCKYICHYRNLKQYLELGLKLKKVHRVLRFEQSPWLKDYIDLNTRLRQEANSKFEEDFAKLMNNSFFGKTCEDVKKYKDIKIVTGEKRAQKLINRPTFSRVKIYNENLAAIQLRKQQVLLNKPRYVGMTILNLSKLIMYDFHYKYIIPKYPGTKLLFTDTDSFCYWIPTDANIYDDMKNNDWMDFSNYNENHSNFHKKFKLIPGKFKDECAGVPILEFVGLRAKMYSILRVDGNIKATCKGVNTAVKREVLKHEHYKDTLKKNKTRMDTMIRIVQDEHQLYTVQTIKCSLSPYNDKKWISKERDEFQSYSFGHYKINEEELIDIMEELCNS